MVDANLLNYTEYSVLMSVYDKEKPEYLTVSIESILHQTFLPKEFIIVEDGKLNSDLEEVICTYEHNYKSMIKIIRLEKNFGLGHALNVGVNACTTDVVARMDSDDYSTPDRCYTQMKKINEGYDIVGCNVAEFQNDIKNLVTYKIMPEDNDSIYKFSKLRNPFNHPTVMFKKKSIINIGNYKSGFRSEDYDLWLRAIYFKLNCYNIQEYLVYMRVSNEFYNRRSGRKNFAEHRNLMKTVLERRQITKEEYFINCSATFIKCFCPTFLRKLLYKKFLRKSAM